MPDELVPIKTMPKTPIIAGVEITTDAEGRFNLNALHKASGLGDSKKPSHWLQTQTAKELIAELEAQSRNSCLESKSSTYDVIKVIKGGSKPGIFGHQLLAISYAGWLSPKFQLQVNQVFLDYRTGKLKPDSISTQVLGRINDLFEVVQGQATQLLSLEQRVEKQKPKVEFYDAMMNGSYGCYSVDAAAPIFKMGRNRFRQKLRELKLLKENGLPYQQNLDLGHFRVTGGLQEDDYGDRVVAAQTWITANGMEHIHKRLEKERTSPLRKQPSFFND